jgi:penicillin-binding protein 1B
MRILTYRRGLLLGGLAAVVLLALLLITYAATEMSRFGRSEARRGTLIYAMPLVLRPGIHVGMVDLGGLLARLGYHETRSQPAGPGQFRRGPGAWDIVLRPPGTTVSENAPRVRLELQGDRIARIRRGQTEVASLALEPEVLTSAGAVPGEAYRPVRLAEVPRALRDAVLAAEDERFFDHGGLDARAVMRAFWSNLRAGRVVEGGSTITQQLVKNRLLSPERTMLRKVQEAWLSTALEWRYSKEQILETYLNEIYLGHWGAGPIRGVGAASRVYFRKEPAQLTLGEAAVLAGMIRAPNSASPAASTDRARARRDTVLARMRELGVISDADHERARREPVRAPAGPPPGLVAPYFVDYVQQEIARRGDEDLGEGDRAGLITTLDVPLQRFAEAAVARGLDELETRWPRLRPRGGGERLQAVLVAVDPATGGIRALIGGRDYRSSQYNRAALARRQPGSAFKPFVYLAALAPRENGPAFTLATHVEDAPITVNVDGKPWAPRNYSDRYEGEVSVRRALEASLNGATVRIAQAVGLPAIVDAARRMGIESELKAVPAMALGAFEVTPLELARAYLPLAAGGQARPVTALATDRESEPPRQAISPAEAYLLTVALQGVIETGTGAGVRTMGLTGAVAGKTGTTNEGRDAWFVGYTSNLITLVWVGFDDGRPHGLSGADAAAPIWTDFMKRATAAYPAVQFETPAGIATARIDPTTGKRATESCPQVVTEVFLSGSEPTACEAHRTVVDRVHRLWDRVWDWFRRQ